MELTPEQLIEQSAAALAKGEWLQSLACSNLAMAKLSISDTKPCGAINGALTDYPCLLSSGHSAAHADKDGDTWT